MVYPSLNRGNVNGNISFSCQNAGMAASWYFEKRKSSPKYLPIFITNILQLEELEIEHAGFYFCYGLYKKKSGKHFLAKAQLKVYGKLCILTNWWHNNKTKKSYCSFESLTINEVQVRKCVILKSAKRYNEVNFEVDATIQYTAQVITNMVYINSS